MSETTFTTIDELSEALASTDARYARIVRESSADLTETFLTLLNQRKHAGQTGRIVCLNSETQRHYREQAAAFDAVEDGDIFTVTQLAEETLCNSEVMAHVGRGPHVLTDNEFDVLIEDLKVTGLRPRRLREMLKFFFKSFSEFADDEPRWIMSPDEQQLLDCLNMNLKARNALLAYEQAPMAFRAAQACGYTLPDDLLIVDDYSTMCLAQQRFIGQLAAGSLYISGTATSAVCAAQDYPFAQGLEDFAAEHADASLLKVATAKDAAKTVNRYNTPADEFEGVITGVKSCLADGMTAQDILVAVPNNTWSKRIASALRSEGVAVNRIPFTAKTKGDPRKSESLQAIKTATFLQLHDNPDNFTALRTWMGLGDWLLCSDAFWEVMDYCEKNGGTVAEAISAAHATGKAEFPLFDKINERLNELDVLEAAYDEAGDNSALFAEHNMATVRIEPNDTEGVVVADYRQCHGRHAQTTFITGCIAGFLPAHDAVDDRFTIDHRKSALQRERNLFDDLNRTAHSNIVYSCFENDLLDNTGILKMEASRVYSKNGTRMARIVTSPFLDGIE